MKRCIPVVVGCLTAACTITVAPIAKTPPKHTAVRHKNPASKISEKPSASSLVVDSDWLIQYRKLEQEHGNYTITDDTKVEQAGNGRYRVTHAMMDHFRDLSQTPVSSPTPR